jgi:dihydrofolate reductase
VSKVLWHITMSLDGFIAGPDDEVRWAMQYAEPNATADGVLETIGALLVGRRTYEIEDRERGGFYGGAWKGPFFVLTHDPPTTVPDWMTGTFIDEDIDSAIARTKAAADGKNVVLPTIDVARSGPLTDIRFRVSQ